jgi:hypothetical protein
VNDHGANKSKRFLMQTACYSREVFVCLGIAMLCGIFANPQKIELRFPEYERI